MMKSAATVFQRSALRRTNRLHAVASTYTRGFAASDESLTKTALNDLHKELGGEMVPFAGYELPVLYKGSENGGVMKEHLWCRADGKASLFDVSHMGQVSTFFVSSTCLACLLLDIAS